MTGAGVADQVTAPRGRLQAEGLAAAVPGPALAALLSSLDLSTVPNTDTVEVLRAAWRQVSHSYATYLAAMVEVSRTAPYPTILAPGTGRTGWWPRGTGPPRRSAQR